MKTVNTHIIPGMTTHTLLELISETGGGTHNEHSGRSGKKSPISVYHVYGERRVADGACWFALYDSITLLWS